MSMVSFLDYGNYKLATFLLMFLSQHQIKTIAKNVKQVQLQSETENLESTTSSSTSTSQVCYDKSATGRDSDCTKYSYLCDNNVYYNLMIWQCPATCKRCSDLIVTSPRTGVLVNGTCIDLKGPNGSSDCSKYSALCRHPRYVSLMATECPKTCRYCR